MVPARDGKGDPARERDCWMSADVGFAMREPMLCETTTILSYVFGADRIIAAAKRASASQKEHR